MIYCSTAEEVNSALEANPNASIDIAAEDGSDLFITIYTGSPSLYIRSGVESITIHGDAKPTIHLYQDAFVALYDASKPHIILYDGAMVNFANGDNAVLEYIDPTGKVCPL